MRTPNLSTAICEILKSMEFGSKKEESLVPIIFEKFGITRKSTIKRTAKAISSKIEKSLINFEDFFGEIFQYFRPFSLMLEEIYEFLNHYHSSIDSRASQFKFNFERLKSKLNFDVSNFPRELTNTFVQKNIKKHFRIFETNLSAKGKYGDNNNSLDYYAIEFISPNYDGDFYNIFVKLVSYFWFFKDRAGMSFKREFHLLEKDLENLFSDIELLIEILFEQYKIEYKKVEMWFSGDLRGNIQEYDEKRERISIRGIEREKRIARDENSYFRNIHLEYILNSLVLALQFWKKKYYRTDFEKRFPFNNKNKDEFYNNPGKYINEVKIFMEEYKRALYDIIIFRGYRDSNMLIKDILEFVRLPYWKNRWHLYELWSLVLVLNFAKRNYEIELNFREQDDYLELFIPKADAKEAVAKIKSNGKELECWFQRKTIAPTTGKGVEPDLRFMKDELFPVDIFIIENKDRKNCPGSHIDNVVEKYLKGTLARDIWIVNYEKYNRSDLLDNLNKKEVGGRNIWIGSNFKPGEIPQEFYLSFGKMLEEYFEKKPQRVHERPTFDLIIDKSGSMKGKPIKEKIERIIGIHNREPHEIFLFDNSIKKIETDRILEFLNIRLECSGGTDLNNSFEGYLKLKKELPKMIYLISDGDGLYECYERYHSKVLERGSSLIFIKV